MGKTKELAYEQAVRDEIRASIEMVRCYKRNVEDSTRRGLLADATALMASWASEHATIRALLHTRRVARHYAGQVR